LRTRGWQRALVIVIFIALHETPDQRWLPFR
jgi:hypothetical protein